MTGLPVNTMLSWLATWRQLLRCTERIACNRCVVADVKTNCTVWLVGPSGGSQCIKQDQNVAPLSGIDYLSSIIQSTYNGHVHKIHSMV